MGLDRALGQAQPFGHIGIGETLGHHPRDVQVPVGQFVESAMSFGLADNSRGVNRLRRGHDRIHGPWPAVVPPVRLELTLDGF